MARGWESKDVESQRADRLEPISQEDKPFTEAERIRQRLELARIRILTELQATCNPRFRAQLEAELTHVDAALRLPHS